MPAKRSKRPPPRPANKADLADQVASANGWTEVVDVLTAYHGLEDLSTRHGLKAVHKSFPKISKRLNATYTKYDANEDVRIGLVMLWWRMCMDSILRDKLVEEGYLAKVEPLLKIERAQSFALDILETVVHHGGLAARWEVVRSVYPTLRRTFKLAVEDGINRKTIDRCVTVLSHAACAVMESDHMKRPVLEIDIPELLHLCTAALRIPKISDSVLYHTRLLIEYTCLWRAKYMLPPSPPGPLQLLIASLRSDNLQDSIDAYVSLSMLYHGPHQCRRIDMPYTPDRLMRVARDGLPRELREAIEKAGTEHSQFRLALRAAADLQHGCNDCAESGDLLQLGWTLFRNILLTEFSVPRGAFGDLYMDESLLHCATALRQAGPTLAKNLDAADCLELKHYLNNHNHSAAAELARRAIQRSPKQPYFHLAYVEAESDPKEHLRRAKYGLKMCNRSTSPYIRCGLLHASYYMSLTLSHEAFIAFRNQKPGRVLEEAFAYLTNALEDSTSWLQLASPDMPGLPETIADNVLLQLILRRKQISPDLKELRSLLDQLPFAQRMSDLLWRQSGETCAERVCKIVIESHTESWSAWAATLQNILLSTAAPMKALDPALANDTTAWLQTVHPSEGYDDSGRCGGADRKKLAPQELYRCTYCTNPSAALKKCARCLRAVYCSTQCQKNHWSEDHKKTCLRPQA